VPGTGLAWAALRSPRLAEADAHDLAPRGRGNRARIKVHATMWRMTASPRSRARSGSARPPRRWRPDSPRSPHQQRPRQRFAASADRPRTGLHLHPADRADICGTGADDRCAV